MRFGSRSALPVPPELKVNAERASVCPACAVGPGDYLGEVNLHKQHSRLFPFDATLRRLLDSETSEVSEYKIMNCHRCGLTYASPMTAPSGRWYALAYEALKVKPEPRWEFDVVLERLASEAVYEIGCGTGMFLHMCQDRGIRAFGIDFSDYCINACLGEGLTAAKSDVHMLHTTLPPSMPVPAVVASFHVLEHLARPDDFFRHSYDVSGPQATLWVSVPSCARVARVLGLLEPFDEPPHHLTKWTEAAFRECGIRNGWELEKVRFERFSWRSALYTVASHFHVYEWMHTKGWLQRSLRERVTRAALYPAALLYLLNRRDRASMSGHAMLACFRKAS